MTQEPPMCVCGVENIDISPFERARGRRNRGGRQTLVQVSMGMVITACFNRDGKPETKSDGDGGRGPSGLHDNYSEERSKQPDGDAQAKNRAPHVGLYSTPARRWREST